MFLDGLQALIPSTFSPSALRHTAQTFESGRVVHRARLHEESERTQPVGERTRREDGLEEVRVGGALRCGGGGGILLCIGGKEGCGAVGEGGQLGR